MGHGPNRTENANRRPGSASVTVHVVTHRSGPRRLVPRKVAPTCAPFPETHEAEVVSGLHSPIRVTSLISAYTSSGAARIDVLTSTSLTAVTPARDAGAVAE